jgi:hypothetical protein
MTEYGSPRPRPSNEQQSGASELLELAIEAHGGHARWREATRITATLSSGGVLWTSRGHLGAFDDVTVTIDAHAQRCSMDRLTGPDRRGVFTPDRVAIETASGELLEERHNPRVPFDRSPTTPWDDLHLAYFAGYAMWTYLTVPFLLAQPGFFAEELEPSEEDGETRRRLRVKFPTHVASHGSEQVFHFDPDGLLRRHDYTPEVLIGDSDHLAVAHYTDRHKRYDGISFPTRRHAVALQPNGATMPEPILVAIDIRHVTVS